MSRHIRAEAPSRPSVTRLSPEERKRIDEAARVNRQTRAEFMREAAMAAAEDCLEPMPRANRHTP